MALSRSPTFLSWSLQRIISRSPGRISALLMPTSAPVTGRTMAPTPELEGSATCWVGGGSQTAREVRKWKRWVGKEQEGNWVGLRKRWEEKRIKEACYIKIQLEIKRNAASNRSMWEDSISSPPPPVNEIRNALGTAFENFIFNMLCTNKEENKHIRKIMVEVKMSANCREHRWLNVSGQARVLWEPGHLQDAHTHTRAIGGEWRAHTLPHTAPGLQWVTQLCGSPGTEYCCALIYLQKTVFHDWGSMVWSERL